jgi:hypothetical protein
MSKKSLKCLVTIKYADVIESRVVGCVENPEGRFLMMPIQDYFLKGWEGHRDLMLHVPAAWYVTLENAPYDFLCREVIDLDKFDGPASRKEADPRTGAGLVLWISN